MIALTLLSSLTAAPASCEELWPRVWQALESQELKGGEPPLKKRFPDLGKRLGPFWVEECKRFTPETLDCARGVQLEAEHKALREYLLREKVPPKEVDAALARMRSEWNVLKCKEVDRSLDRAAAALAKDAGL